MRKFDLLSLFLIAVLAVGCFFPAYAKDNYIDFDYMMEKVGDGTRNLRQVVIIDARDAHKYDKSHIPSAINIPYEENDEYIKQFDALNIGKTIELVVYDNSGWSKKADKLADILKSKGYSNLKVYNKGFDGWEDNDGYMEISTNMAKELFDKNKAVFVDARPSRKYSRGTIQGAVNVFDMKFDEMKTNLPEDKKQLLVTFCGGYPCAKSHNVAKDALKEGYKNVKVFAAGFPEWKDSGFPVEKK